MTVSRFCFFVFLAIGGAVASQYFLGEVVFAMVNGTTTLSVVKALNKEAAIIAGIAFVMFVIEVLMRKVPGHKVGKNAPAGNDPNSNASVVLYVY